MKRFLTLSFLLAVCFVSCSKDNDDGINVNSKISITGAPTTRRTNVDVPIKGTAITDSVEFAVKYMVEIWFKSTDGREQEWRSPNFGMTEEQYNHQRDLVANKILYQGGQVITLDGELGSFVSNCKDAVFVSYNDHDGNAIHPLEVLEHPDWMGSAVVYDTIGYIPNAITTQARNEITTAFNLKDYKECYRLFDELFVFRPITGEKWRALKDAGIE